ncbi:uncharacterized protein LOC122379800 [Amphibalanus amphitrite]|uniref:uncharacterized protein LOC122379800 n=1 Tax=Amphibalanus amphitrite TaxID=1232801 RepID=UPI001C914100|nr:uncharacterized protein LOC122379800 [Amphibalanus amphitrite]
MGAGSTKPGEPGQRTVHTFDESKSSSDEPTETSFGLDTPPPKQKRSPPRRNPAAKAASAAVSKRGAASSSRRSAAANGSRDAPGTSAGGGGVGLDTRAASAADLSSQLDELDATFTSLGIVGRQLGGDGSSFSSPSSLQSSQTSCQLQQQLDTQQSLQQSSGSTCSRSGGSRASREKRRSQPFSWEQRSASQQENWQYQKVSLDGFDPEKFKKANKGAGFDDSIGLPRDFGARGGNMAVPEYDHQDQQILASIERDFDKLIPL